jgi:hypothetical protein
LDSFPPRREISTHEASQISGLTVTHIALLIRQGKLEGRRFGNRSWMVYADSLERYLSTPHRPGPHKKQPQTQVDTSALQPGFPGTSGGQPLPYTTKVREKLVVGYQYGEELFSDIQPHNLYSLASTHAVWLMEQAHVDRFAVDDCILLTKSNNYEGWGPQDIQTTVLSIPLPIPKDLEQLQRDKLPLIQQYFFNSAHYRLIAYTPMFTHRDYLEVMLAPLSFYEYYSLTPFLDEPLLTASDGSKVSARQKYGQTALTYTLNQGTCLIPAPITIQGIIITKDAQIILMQRSPLVAFYPHHWSTSFEEVMNAPGMNRPDKPSRSGDADFFATTLRGLDEEFAIPASAVESIKILSLNVEYLVLAVGAIALVRVDLTAEEVRAGWLTMARDADEASKFDMFPAEMEAVVEKLFSKVLWHPTARMRLIQFLFHTYGVREVAKAIQERQE